MLAGGEDFRFISRRLVISAAEDIGLADPQGLVVANAAAQAAERVGMPEAKLILSQAAVYLATAPKSNSACLGIGRAMRWWRRPATYRLQSTCGMPIMPGQRSWATASAISIPMIFPIIGWSSSTCPTRSKMRSFTSLLEKDLRKN